MKAQRQEANRAPRTSPSHSTWQLLLRWRWWLGCAIGLAFAGSRALESLLQNEALGAPKTMFDIILWGGLGGIAVWFSLTWASRQEQRHQVELEYSLQQQQDLNFQLQRTNAHLALLCDVNQRLAASASLDEILDQVLHFPQHLVPCQAAALWLQDPTGEVLARATYTNLETLHSLRKRYTSELADCDKAQIVTARGDPDGLAGACLRLPVSDGAVTVGWIELYLDEKRSLPEDEWALLDTIAGEIGEAIGSARRRSREKRAIYELELAIAEERARIARDIHDGLAQTLAFRRMRVDLWLDWLDQDPQRLAAELVDLKQLLREQIAEVRRAIFALRPLQFDELGFVGGMHRYVTDFGSQQGWEVQVDLSGISELLSPQLEATCFRIVQEALTNAAKHANPTAITVSSRPLDGGIQISIYDNGKGFEPGRLETDEGRLGLRQMRERLAALHGRLTILSQPGSGTELRVWIPVDQIRDGKQREKEGL